jgi:phosphoenolpyruvate phosphomutase
MYYKTPAELFEEVGVSLVIWANHLMRASIKAMQETAAEIYEARTLASIENKIVPVKEIFRLQNAQELKVAEKRYLPVNGNSHLHQGEKYS